MSPGGLPPATGPPPPSERGRAAPRDSMFTCSNTLITGMRSMLPAMVAAGCPSSETVTVSDASEGSEIVVL